VRLELGEGMSITTEYYDFGVPVQVTPPPADQIMSQDEFWEEIMAHQGDSACSGGTNDESPAKFRLLGSRGGKERTWESSIGGTPFSAGASGR
jgi:hypothetical protein